MRNKIVLSALVAFVMASAGCESPTGPTRIERCPAGWTWAAQEDSGPMQDGWRTYEPSATGDGGCWR